MHDDNVDHNLSNLKSNLHVSGFRSERLYMPTMSELKHKDCKLRESHGNMYNSVCRSLWLLSSERKESPFISLPLSSSQFLHHVPPLQPIRHTPRPWIRFIYLFSLFSSRGQPLPPSLLALAVRHLSPHSACFLALFPIVLNLPKLFKTLCLLLVPKTSSKLHENCKLGNKKNHICDFFFSREAETFLYHLPLLNS